MSWVYDRGCGGEGEFPGGVLEGRIGRVKGEE